MRFRAPSIGNTQVAAQDRTRGLVVHNKSGAYQFYAWDISKGEMRQLTNRPEGTSLYACFLSPDGRFVYYLNGNQGNEIGHYVRIPFEGGTLIDLTPDLPQYSSLAGDPCFANSRSGNIVGFTADSPEGFHLYCIDVAADGKFGQPRLLRSSKRLAAGPQLSYDGKIAFWASSERSSKEQFGLLAIDTKTGEKIAELWDGPDSGLDYQSAITSPIKDDYRILTATNRAGVERLLIWNPHSGERVDLDIDVTGSMRAFDWSPNGERILFRTFNHAVQQLYVYDLIRGALSKLNQPGGSNGGPYFWTDREIWSHWQDPTHPPCLIALDAESGIQTRSVLAAGEVPGGHHLKSITFASSDGQEIQGWLGMPDGEGPFPAVLETHGGPKAVTSLAYSPGSQSWIDNGFAFFSINYRGSVTFGREFEDKIYGNPGYWEVEDMVAARDWLVKAGIARPDKILVTGWSYGGYLTLQALGKRPGLWAGGMAGVAIADWGGLYEHASDTMKAWAVALLGGTPGERPDQYKVSSPITYADKVESPVLIIQGRNDTRTPGPPVEMYEMRMKALGKEIEVHWFDAGHLASFAQVEKSIEHQELMLRFARRILDVSRIEEH